ncbi:MAG: hypothetical protein WCF57_19510 [Pyrinomonadaceae bacterium]
MKRWKKVVLLLLGAFLLSQIPFIYRRFQLRRLSLAINELNAQRVAADQAASDYLDYKGVIHVHSLLGGHSTGTFTEIIDAANSNDLDFVVMTEHPSKQLDTAGMTLKGVYGKTLFINGSEISTMSGDRFLFMPGGVSARDAAAPPSTQDVLAQKNAQESLAFVAYPKEFRSWEASGYDGIEVYNVYTNARRINPLVTLFDGVWSYWGYAELLFTRFYERPDASLRQWDELLAASGNRRLVAIAGNDAHSNIGFSLLVDGAGKKFLQVKLDPYERSFRLVRNHVLLAREQPLTAASLLTAIKSGHSYIAFDLLSEATGFNYEAQNRVEKKIMGDEIGLEDGVRLTVTTPLACRIRLFKDGKVVQERDGASKQEFLVDQKGVYRVEAYLTQLGNSFTDRPWIISNPIYVR